MPILGAHMSIAGGYYRAVEIAHAAGCDCVQLFTKNNNQWRAKEIDDASAERFKTALVELGIKHPLSHDSYLINLAAPDEALWQRSIEAFIVELQRAERLGIPYVVTHPGAFTSSSEEAGLRRVVAALDEVHAQTRGLASQCLLETTAGQGSCLGWRFEHLATILDGVRDPERLGLCVDTCHVFAAGYPLADPRDYESTMAELDRLVGLKLVKAFHLNDSLRELGSRVDRHTHIGEGHLGLEPFRNLLADERFAQVPMYLETPKGDRDGEDLDVINLRTLRGLLSTSDKRASERTSRRQATPRASTKKPSAKRSVARQPTASSKVARPKHSRPTSRSGD
ncbi:MAG: deoxyribonuclease IV [Pirellulales bacterium]